MQARVDPAGYRLQQRYTALPPPASEDPDLVLEDAFLLKIREIVDAHISESDFEMPQLERALGVSYSQVFRKVKALTGASPSVFIRSVRLHKAKALLRNSALTIAEVACEVGFSTPAYFNYFSGGVRDDAGRVAGRVSMVRNKQLFWRSPARITQTTLKRPGIKKTTDGNAGRRGH